MSYKAFPQRVIYEQTPVQLLMLVLKIKQLENNIGANKFL